MKGLSGRLRECVEWQEVYSPALGKYVRRCAAYAPKGGGLSGLGQLDIARSFGLDPEVIKNTAINGGFAAGGAWLAQKFTNWLATVGKEEGEEPRFKGTLYDVVMILAGIAIGAFVGKAFRRPQIGLAMATGPAVVVGLRVLGQIVGETSTAASAATEGLGIITATPTKEFEPAAEPPISTFIPGTTAASVV